MSDLLQHDPKGYSHYKTAPDLKAPQASELWPQVRARFDGVYVLAEYVARTNDAQFQTQQHRKFWRDYFNDADAADIVFLDENPEARL